MSYFENVLPHGLLRAFRNACVSCVLLSVGSMVSQAQTTRFVDDSFDDFAAGVLEDGGQNLYVSRDGALRNINRFDLNADGFLDILFNCTHNTYQMLPVTVGSVSRDRTTTSRELAFEGSQRLVIADLNRDSHADVVICPNPIGVHHDRRFVMIGWGGPDGWSSQRINSPLPMNAPATVEVADLNADIWPDICVLGAAAWQIGQPEGRIIRVYWGSSAGYSTTDLTDLGVVSAIELAAADLDADGARDLAVLRSNGGLTIFWSQAIVAWNSTANQTELPVGLPSGSCMATGDFSSDGRNDIVVGTTDAKLLMLASKGQRQWHAPKTIEAVSCSQITAQDLDGDTHHDLVLVRFDQARAAGGEQAGAAKNSLDSIAILWGAANDSNWKQSTSLNVANAVATDAGDLDGDGKMDLAVAVHQGPTTFNGESIVLYGQGNRSFARGSSGFRTSGTLDVAIAQAEKNLPSRVVFCNSIGGELDEAVPLHLFWGAKTGFDANRIWKIPFHSGYESSAADLNLDGHVDLLCLNSGHSGQHAHIDATLGANIIWGGPAGLPSSTERTVLHEHFLGTSSVADLNRDGWLDLILEPFAAEKAGEKEPLIIYYGGSDGFPRSRRTVLEMDGYAQEHMVADFNRDAWLDIAVTSRSLDAVRILWGHRDGFSTTRELRLKVAGPVGVDVADFNSDGWLDLLAGSYNDPKSGHRDMGLVIFWGNSTGFQHSNAQWLPGFSPLGRTSADFDADGFLDLVSPQHSGELTREDLACHLYWGSATGFSRQNRTTLFNDSVNDTLAGDFNGDGKIDLAMNAHTRHGDHRTRSSIYYNDGQRFANPTVQRLPTNGPHLLWATDIGHIYHRRYEQGFQSRVYQWQEPLSKISITITASHPAETRVEVFVRSASAPVLLDRAPWKQANSSPTELANQDRCAQYRLVLHSDNGDRYPMIEKVELELK